MPRLMSVAHTEDQVRQRAKTVTRRGGWWFLKPGDRLTLCPKVMGRRSGDVVQPLERLVDVEVVDTRPEQLQDITHDDVIAEGFPDWTREQFLDFFCDAMGGTGLQVVNRIQWRYLEPVADTIEAAVRGYRFLYGDERALQEGLLEALTRAGLAATREVSLNPRGRIDFIVDSEIPHVHGPIQLRTGVEVKVAGGVEPVVRQLASYAPHVDDLVLITTRAAHRDVPAEVRGKPVRVVHIRGAAW